MSNDNVRPFEFINFEEFEKEGKDPLLHFNIKRKKKFIPEFKTKDKYEFRELFSLKGELTKEDYEKSVKEYYENQKKEIDKKIEELFNLKKKEAEQIVEKAKQEAEKIEKEAYEKGFQQGKEEGIKEGEKEVLKIINDFKLIVKRLENFENELILKHETEISKLIVDLVKLIVKIELTVNSDKILYENLKETLKKIVDKGKIEIKINPSQYDYISEKLKRLSEIEEIEELKITKSNEIEPGGCIVETNFGTYDARIKEQLIELEKILTDNSKQ